MSTEQSEPGRPKMPAGYGVSGLENFVPVSWEWVTERLRNSRNYWIATTMRDGSPHVAPVWGLWLDDRVMFSTDAKSAKGRNAARNPACSIHLESGDEVVILKGVLERVTDPNTLRRFNEAYDAKYGINPESGSDEGPVYALKHEVVLAWLEKDFPATATRWAFE